MTTTMFLDLVIGLFFSFGFSVICMFVLKRISIIPEWSRWVLVVLFSIVFVRVI